MHHSNQDSSEDVFLNQEFSALQVLIELGLTQTQARVYVALVKSGSSRVLAIAKNSNVARPDVYQTLSKLQQRGLVEKVIKTPPEYRAISIDEGISLLLETITKRYKKVAAGAKVFLDTIKIERPKAAIQIESPHFVLVPRRTVIQRMKTAIEKAQLSLDFVLSWRMFSRGMTSVFFESMDVAWAKNVKVRFIIESPSESKTANQLIQFCREKAFCRIRFTCHYPEVIFGVFDKKECFITVNPEANLLSSPSLWSNNHSLIALAEDHFETLWLTARKIYH